MHEIEREREPVGQCEECGAWTMYVKVLRVDTGLGGIHIEKRERLEFQCGHKGERAGES